MQLHLKIWIFLFIFLFLFVKPSYALTINEIYSSPVTGQTEWVELYNESDSTVDLSNYTLTDIANNKITIPSGQLFSHDFLVVPSSSVLNNSGDTINLMSANTSQIVTYPSLSSSEVWTSCPDGMSNFQKSSTQTKQSSNTSSCPLSPTPSDVPTPSLVATIIVSHTPSPTPLASSPTPVTIATPTIHQSYSLDGTQVFMTETYPAPMTGGSEAIEIYNPTNTDILLGNWLLDDGADTGGSPITLDLLLPAQKVTVFTLDKNLFNNDGDIVRLINSEGAVIDSMTYTSTPLDRSWTRQKLEKSSSFCLAYNTLGTISTTCVNTTQKNISATPTPYASDTNLEKSTQIVPTDFPSKFSTIPFESSSQNIDFGNLQSTQIDSNNLNTQSSGRVLGASSDQNDSLDSPKTKATSTIISVKVLLITLSMLCILIAFYLKYQNEIKKYYYLLLEKF